MGKKGKKRDEGGAKGNFLANILVPMGRMYMPPYMGSVYRPRADESYYYSGSVIAIDPGPANSHFVYYSVYVDRSHVLKGLAGGEGGEHVVAHDALFYQAHMLGSCSAHVLQAIVRSLMAEHMLHMVLFEMPTFAPVMPRSYLQPILLFAGSLFDMGREHGLPVLGVGAQEWRLRAGVKKDKDVRQILITRRWDLPTSRPTIHHMDAMAMASVFHEYSLYALSDPVPYDMGQYIYRTIDGSLFGPQSEEAWQAIYSALVDRVTESDVTLSARAENDENYGAFLDYLVFRELDSLVKDVLGYTGEEDDEEGG